MSYKAITTSVGKNGVALDSEPGEGFSNRGECEISPLGIKRNAVFGGRPGIFRNLRTGLFLVKAYLFRGMRSLVAFLIGLIIGGVAILFLPDTRRENLNTELRGQIVTLQKQIQDLGGQLKDIQLPTPAASTPAPSPKASPTPQ